MSTFCAPSSGAVKPAKLREIRNLSGCNLRVNVTDTVFHLLFETFNLGDNICR
jgi:hypothetical protein